MCLHMSSFARANSISCRQVLPEAPPELVAELSRRYIYLYEQITGEKFQPVSSTEDPQERMTAAVQEALQQMQF